MSYQQKSTQTLRVTCNVIGPRQNAKRSSPARNWISWHHVRRARSRAKSYTSTQCVHSVGHDESTFCQSMQLVVRHSDVIEMSLNPDARSIERCGRINRTYLAKRKPDKTPRSRSAGSRIRQTQRSRIARRLQPASVRCTQLIP
jgi:hypothetical protein